MSGSEEETPEEPRPASAQEASDPAELQAVTVRVAAAGLGEPGAPLASEVSLAPGYTLAGRYTVLDLLGRGGMGVVLAAYDARLDRRVALKILRHDEDSEQADEGTRLVSEAQAMARLNHPHVVAVYDAGALEDGSLFIAMEYVQGQTLRQWRAQEPRSWRQVLEAYLAAGRGLAAAHAVGLIHRDFKPDNVLVGQDGRVRVTDFGLARAQNAADSEDASLESDSQENTTPGEPGSWSGFVTLPSMFIGTPAYMAPELFRNRPADVRSDLFAFCASLYEALFGELPFRGSSPSELTRAQLKGKVIAPPASSEVPAWVTRTVLWGLQADPQQRPASMEALLAALGADPEAQRRIWLRSAALAVVVVTLAGLAAWGWGRQRDGAPDCEQVGGQLTGIWDGPVRAKVEAALRGTGLPYAQDTAARVAAVLDGYAGTWVKQRTEVCQALRRQAATSGSLAVLQETCLERRREQLRAFTELLSRAPDPELVPRAVQVAQALPPLEYCTDAQALTAAVPPPEDPIVRTRVAALQAEVDRLETLLDAGKYQEGLVRAEALLAEVEPVGHAPLSAQATLLVAYLRESAGDYKGAEELARKAILLASRGRDSSVLVRAWVVLVSVVGYRQARHQEAAQLELGLEAAVEADGDDFRRCLALRTQGILLAMRGRFEEARRKFEQALALTEKSPRPEPLLVTSLLNNLGNVLEEMGYVEEARQRHERTLALREEALGPEHPLVAISLDNLGGVLTTLGQYEEARARFERALALRERTLGPEHPRVVYTLISLGVALAEVGEYEEAMARFERALALQEKTLGPEHPDVADTLHGLGRALAGKGQYEEARRMHERGLALRQKALGPEHARVASSLDALGAVLTTLKRYDEARRMHERALALHEKALGKEHPELSESLLGLGRLRLLRGQPGEALPLLERALVLAPASGRAQVQLALAQALWAAGKERERAVALATEAREHWERLRHPHQAEATQWLAAHAAP